MSAVSGGVDEFTGDYVRVAGEFPERVDCSGNEYDNDDRESELTRIIQDDSLSRGERGKAARELIEDFGWGRAKTERVIANGR